MHLNGLGKIIKLFRFAVVIFMDDNEIPFNAHTDSIVLFLGKGPVLYDRR